jgi:O-antigen ligase
VSFVMLATAHGLGEGAEKLGVIAVALLTAMVVLSGPARARGAGLPAAWSGRLWGERLVAVSERGRAVALLAVLALTPVLLAIDIWHTTQLHHLRAHPAEAAGAIVLGLAAVAALAVLVHRSPRAFPVLAVAALPFRLPISTGGSTSNLLIPLYLVVGGASLAYLVPRLTGGRPGVGGGGPGADGAGAAPGAGVAPGAGAAPGAGVAPGAGAATGRPTSGSGAAAASIGSSGAGVAVAAPGGSSGARGWPARAATPRGLEWLLMASVVLYALQAAYSADFSKALENMVFFYVPFALLFALLREVRWTRELLLACLATAVLLAVVLAGIGFVEYDRKHLFLNPKVVAANQYDNFFRVNSLFFDPNIYGRFLALVILAVMTGVLWSVRRREVLLGGAVVLWLLAGVVTSFSQSSIAALLLGLAVLAAWRWDLRGTLYVAGALVAIALVVVLVAPPNLHLGLSGRGGSASNATSGRTKLIEGGLRLFADRPLQGFGPGSFAREYRSHNRKVDGNSATSASHTIPVTVAAEQGIVGLALYAALLLAAFAVLFAGAGRSPPRIALAACFAALVLHTFTYADFLEDPLTWTLLGIGVALAAAEGASRRCATI